MVADDIYNLFQDENIMEDDLPKVSSILKSLFSMLAFKNTLTLYKEFYQKAGLPEMFAMPAKKTLGWADVFPFLYLHAAFQGLKVSKITKHLVRYPVNL